MLLELQAKLRVLQLMFLVSKLQPMLIGVASRGGGVGGASGDGGVVGVGPIGGASSMRRGRSKSLSSRRRSQHGRAPRLSDKEVVEHHKKRWEGPTKKCYLDVVNMNGAKEDVQKTSNACIP